jgi:hypothetical protein
VLEKPRTARGGIDAIGDFGVHDSFSAMLSRQFLGGIILPAAHADSRSIPEADNLRSYASRRESQWFGRLRRDVRAFRANSNASIVCRPPPKRSIWSPRLDGAAVTEGFHRGKSDRLGHKRPTRGMTVHSGDRQPSFGPARTVGFRVPLDQRLPIHDIDNSNATAVHALIEVSPNLSDFDLHPGLGHMQQLPAEREDFRHVFITLLPILLEDVTIVEPGTATPSVCELDFVVVRGPGAPAAEVNQKNAVNRAKVLTRSAIVEVDAHGVKIGVGSMRFTKAATWIRSQRALITSLSRLYGAKID